MTGGIKYMERYGKKVAFLFSGQGVQASIIREHYKFLVSKDASRTEKFVQTLQDCFSEINPEIKIIAADSLIDESSDFWIKTSFIQPLIYTLSLLSFELFKDKNIQDYIPEYFLGHSLGAFSALTAAGSLSFEQGCSVVCVRGKFMQEESENADNGMCAIIGLAEDKVQEICRKTNTEIALINAPTAFVVGCPRSIFPEIEREAIILGAVKTIRLGTSGAFHTKTMQGAYEKFKVFFEKYPLSNPQVSIVSNMKGAATMDIEELRYDCIESTINPINWVRMMGYLKNKVSNYIESGPGTSLSSLCKMNGIEKERILHVKTILE